MLKGRKCGIPWKELQVHRRRNDDQPSPPYETRCEDSERRRDRDEERDVASHADRWPVTSMMEWQFGHVELWQMAMCRWYSDTKRRRQKGKRQGGKGHRCKCIVRYQEMARERRWDGKSKTMKCLLRCGKVVLIFYILRTNFTNLTNLTKAQFGCHARSVRPIDLSVCLVQYGQTYHVYLVVCIVCQYICCFLYLQWTSCVHQDTGLWLGAMLRKLSQTDNANYLLSL
jgi:hypothetical protein